MFWRPGRGELPGQWHGPARVIIQESNHVIWISHSSRVYRVAPEHVRSLSEREADQCQSQVESGVMEVPPRDKGRGVFQYEDLTEVVNPAPNAPTVVPRNDDGSGPVVDVSEQPDAEPSHNPSPPPSNAYTPTTPMSDNPNETTLEPEINPIPSVEEPTDPKDVPVPDDADDELITEDYWLTQGDKIIRVHQTPRRKAFNPCSVTDCPVDILSVCEQRFTTGNSVGQEMWSFEDSWGQENSSWQWNQLWTGVTIFHVLHETSDTMDEPMDILHLEEAQGFALEVFFTQEDLDHVMEEPTSLPVFVAAAAKRQRAEIKVKDLTPDELKQFQVAKNKELDQWLDTQTVRKILRSKIPDQNILRCRWVLTWKELDAIDAAKEGLEPPLELREKLSMRENEVCELLKSAYGLVNAPYLWYQELKECLQELHFSMSPLDPCLFVLADSNGFVHGALGVHVDDGLCAGDHFFLQTLEKLEKRFPFGSKRSGDFTFTGIHVCQDEQYNIHLDQRDYVMNIEPIRIDRSRRKLEQAEVTEEEKQGLRGLIGSLQYAASNTRPDVSARLSLLQSRINCARIIDLLEANRLLGDAKKNSEVKITISSIPEDKVRMIAYSDASFATREKQQSQKGNLILAAHADVFQQKIATASPLTWSSKKIGRVVASTLAAETFALSHAVDALNWIRLAWEWIRNPQTPWQKPEEVWRQAPPGIAVVVNCIDVFPSGTRLRDMSLGKEHANRSEKAGAVDPKTMAEVFHMHGLSLRPCHGKAAVGMNLRGSDQLELNDILQSVKVAGNAGKLQEILKSLAEKKKIQLIFVTLELLRDKGFDFHSSNYLVGISACAKSKLWQHACVLFSSLPQAKLQPDVKSFNAAVSACEKGGQWQQAASYIARMPSANIQPNVITYSSGISACEKGGQWQQALNLFDSMQEGGVEPNVITYSAVISAFEKGGQWQQALSLFDHMTQEDVQPDVICFNAALSSLEKGSQWQQALSFFHNTQISGLQLDVVSYSAAISACEKVGQWQQALWLFHSMQLPQSTNVRPNVVTFNAVISSCEKGQQWEQALKIFEGIGKVHLKPSIVSCNSVISACEKCGQWQAALSLFQAMEGWEVSPDVITFNAIISCCEKGWKPRLGLDLFQSMPDYLVQPDVFSYSAVITSFEKASQWQNGLNLFDLMPEAQVYPNIVTFNAAINCCQNGGQWQKALRFFGILAASGEAEIVSYSATISCCANVGEWQHALSLFESMLQHSIRPNVIACNAAIDSCEKGRQWQQALSFLDLMTFGELEPDVISFNSAIRSLEAGGQWQKALQLFDDMLEHDIPPNLLSHSAAVTCSELRNSGRLIRHCGLLESHMRKALWSSWCKMAGWKVG
eukprot:s1032_g19.t1